MAQPGEGRRSVTKWRTPLLCLLGIELVAVPTLVARRLNSTQPQPPLVEQYNDALTGPELLALPNQFLYDGIVKWRTLAETYMAFGYFAKADACFRRAAADSRSPDVAFLQGYCLVRVGRLDEAREAFRRVVAGKDTGLSSRAWYHLGETHLRLEQPK